MSDKQQMPFRMHRNDYKLMKKKLSIDCLSFQSFVTTMVQAYLDNDKSITDIINKCRLSELYGKKRDKTFSFSNREKRELLNKLEELSDLEEVV